MKQSLFLKLPLSSRKWPGSNTSGLGNSWSSFSTEVSDVNTVVPWNENEDKLCYKEVMELEEMLQIICTIFRSIVEGSQVYIRAMAIPDRQAKCKRGMSLTSVAMRLLKWPPKAFERLSMQSLVC